MALHVKVELYVSRKRRVGPIPFNCKVVNIEMWFVLLLPSNSYLDFKIINSYTLLTNHHMMLAFPFLSASQVHLVPVGIDYRPLPPLYMEWLPTRLFPTGHTLHVES